MKGKIRIRKTEDNTVYVVKTEKFISPEEAEAIRNRLQHAKEMRRHHKKSSRKLRMPQEN